jgi:hypothetical protein
MPTIDHPCLMLVCTTGDELSALLLPDATRPMRRSRHPDGEIAKLHWAGLIVTEKGSTEIREQLDLNRHRVEITDGTGGPCFVADGLAGIPDLGEMVNPSGAGRAPVHLLSGDALQNRVAAIVTYEGGRFETVPESKAPVISHYPTATGSDLGAEQMTAYSRWTTNSDEVTVRVLEFDGRVVQTFTLRGDDQMVIYDWDVYRPLLEDLIPLQVPKCVPGQVITDEDFRWLYQLLEPSEGNWAAWLATVPRRKLPAPEVRCGSDTEAAMEMVTQAFDVLRRSGAVTIDRLIVTAGTAACDCGRWRIQ